MHVRTCSGVPVEVRGPLLGSLRQSCWDRVSRFCSCTACYGQASLQASRQFSSVGSHLALRVMGLQMLATSSGLLMWVLGIVLWSPVLLRAEPSCWPPSSIVYFFFFWLGEMVSNRCVQSKKISVKWGRREGHHRAWWHQKHLFVYTLSQCLSLVYLSGWKEKKGHTVLGMTSTVQKYICFPKSLMDSPGNSQSFFKH